KQGFKLVVSLVFGHALRDHLGKPGYRRTLKQAAHRQVNVKALLHAGDELRRQQRVSAEIEEAGMDTDLFHTKHVGPHLRQFALQRRAGRNELLLRPVVVTVGHGQRPAVHLAARPKRKLVQRDKRGRNHVGGQLREQVLAQIVAHKLRAAYRDDVGYKLAVAGSVLTHRDYRLADAGVSAQHGLDLAQLHAEPTHLDLVIHPPQELKVAVRQVADEVAGAVHPRARLA